MMDLLQQKKYMENYNAAAAVITKDRSLQQNTQA
jgi:hypothetical protein